MMMRIVLAAGLLFAAISFDVRSAKAAEGPVCAFLSMGNSSVYEDCHYRTFEECQPNVLAGNRGFCNYNPRWTGPLATSRRSGKRHAQR